MESKSAEVQGSYLYIVKAELATALVRGNNRFSFSKHAVYSPTCVREEDTRLVIDLPDGQQRVIPRNQVVLWDWLPVVVIPPMPPKAVRFTPESTMFSDIVGDYWDEHDVLVATLDERGNLRMI